MVTRQHVELVPETVPNARAISDLMFRQWRCELPSDVLRDALAEMVVAARSRGVDVLFTPARLLETGARLIITDVDSTLIQDEVIELLADHAGSRVEVARVTEAAMRGELDFTESLIQRVATLRGLKSDVLATVKESLRLSSGVENLCRTLAANGDYIGVVSGGFIEIVQPLADDLGINFARANRLAIEGNVLTGEVLGPVVDQELKAATLREWAAEVGVPMSRTVAIGDGANDLSMLAAAGLGVAYNAKPIVQQKADTAITGPRIDAILAVLGR